MGKRILVADDDPTTVNMMRMALESDGYDVETATDGSDAARPRTPQPDLILLDVRLGGRDGREICRRLKEQVATRDIPVLLVSGDLDVAQAADQCGADGVVTKPFGLDDLLGTVKRYAGGPASAAHP